MIKLWKDFKVNFMYWRFRNITRNRLRLQAWWSARRGPNRVGARPATRPRASALYSPYPRSAARRSWYAFGAMVLLLTAVTEAAHQGYIAPGISYTLDTLVVVGAIYWALRGT